MPASDSASPRTAFSKFAAAYTASQAAARETTPENTRRIVTVPQTPERIRRLSENRPSDPVARRLLFADDANLPSDDGEETEDYDTERDSPRALERPILKRSTGATDFRQFLDDETKEDHATFLAANPPTGCRSGSKSSSRTAHKGRIMGQRGLDKDDEPMGRQQKKSRPVRIPVRLSADRRMALHADSIDRLCDREFHRPGNKWHKKMNELFNAGAPLRNP